MVSQGYTKTSIVFHWAAALIIIVLYLTGEGERGSFVFSFHIGFGAIAGVFLIWRSLRRFLRGMPDKSDQSEMLNLLSKSVIWGFLLSMIAVIATGYLIIWWLGQPVNVFGLFAIPSPFGAHHVLHEGAEEVHELIAQLILFLLALHIAGALKHRFIDRDGVMDKILKSDKNGK